MATIPSLYLDTSIIGGYFDSEFCEETRTLFRMKAAGYFHFVSSQLVLKEIERAPENVRQLTRSLFSPNDVIAVDERMERLSAAYMLEKIVPTDYVDDAQHVAICSIARINYLVSWNFKHLANPRRETRFNHVNRLHGFPEVRIVSPTFLIHGYEEKDPESID